MILLNPQKKNYASNSHGSTQTMKILDRKIKMLYFWEDISMSHSKNKMQNEVT